MKIKISAFILLFSSIHCYSMDNKPITIVMDGSPTGPTKPWHTNLTQQDYAQFSLELRQYIQELANPSFVRRLRGYSSDRLFEDDYNTLKALPKNIKMRLGTVEVEHPSLRSQRIIGTVACTCACCIPNQSATCILIGLCLFLSELDGHCARTCGCSCSSSKPKFKSFS